MTAEAPVETHSTSTAPPDATDIYALLGVHPDASRLLAREMYWSRVQPLLDPERRDDPSVRAAIEALNDALAIVTDDDRRAAYDARNGVEERRQQETRTRRRQRRLVRASWLALLVAGFGAALVLLATTSSWQVAIVPAVAVPLVRVVASRLGRRRRPAPGALDRLGLVEGASRYDLDVAYQTRAQELLLRLRSDARALDDLNRLDRDYLTAMRQVMGIDVPREERVRRDRTGPLRRFAGTQLRKGAQSLRTLASRADAPPRPMLPVRPVEPAVAVDLEQRLAASLKANAIQIAERVSPDAAPAAPAAATAVRAPAFLLLSSSVGVRRVPVEGRPLRIGSGSECDLVLPAREQVQPEHALVWRHGDAVILHATDPDAQCEVNGHASSWATLEDGDELTVGLVRLRIEIGAAEG